MPVTVSDQATGITIHFPDGTDHDTIARAMQQATGGGESKPSLLESFGRGAVEGATFGFDDRLGMDKSRREASRKENPWTHFAGELVGGIVPAIATGGAAAAVRGGTSVASKVAQAALRPFASAPVDTLGAAIGQGAKLGASFGALSGAGHAEDGQMLEGAGYGAAAGGIMGSVLGPAAYKIGEKINIARAARNEMASSDTASMAAIDRALARDQIDPSTLRAQIEVPQYGKLSSEQITDLVGRVRDGEAVTDVARSLGIGQKAATEAIQRFEAQNAAPLSIVDRARITGAAGGENTSWTLRAGMASPGRGRADAAEALTQRQMGQAGRVADAADRIVASGDPEARQALMRAAEKQAYDTAHANAKPFDLTQPLNAVDEQYAGRATSIAKEMQKASELFAEKAPGRPPQFQPFRRLDHFQEAKADLDQMIAGSMKDHRATPLTRRLMDFKRQVMDEVSAANPEWRVANDMFAENAIGRRLFGDAQSQSFRITPETRKEMVTVANLHRTISARGVPAAQKTVARGQLEMYRDGLAEAITSHAMNRSETGDHVAKFLTPAGRQIIATVLGKKDGAAMMKALEAEQAITRTYRGLGGSQTTPLREAIDELNGPALMASAWEMASPRKLIDTLIAKGSARLSEARNNRMVPMLVEADPLKQLNILRDVELMRAARRTGGGVGVTAVTPVGNAVVDSARPKQKKRSGMIGAGSGW